MIKLEDPLRDATIQDLISWLEEQDTEEKYDYLDSRNCLLCRFLRAHGISSPGANPNQWHKCDYNRVDLPYGFNSISQGRYGEMEVKWTFGAALERARSFEVKTSGAPHEN